MTIKDLFSAPVTRAEIIARLRELSLPIQSASLNSVVRENCEFFLDDLAFGPPYVAAVGMILRSDEVEQFSLFMTSIAELWHKLKANEASGNDSLREDALDEVAERARRLLKTMQFA